MDAEFGPSMIYIINLDKPGFIAVLLDAGDRDQHRDFHVGPSAGGNAMR